jgi:hypothetical protein
MLFNSILPYSIGLTFLILLISKNQIFALSNNKNPKYLFSFPRIFFEIHLFIMQRTASVKYLVLFKVSQGDIRITVTPDSE